LYIDNNKVISTSYNFVRFENVTLSKYCYQYHFLYKYRCNKCCESITWGGYNDCDDYKQYKLYIGKLIIDKKKKISIFIIIK